MIRRRLLAFPMFASLALAALLAGCVRGSHASTVEAPATAGAAAAPSGAPQPPTPAAAATRAPESAADRSRLPDRLSDAAYWALETSISEPGGYFQIVDNFTSNEMEVGELFTMLRDARVQGGVYLGVGPEQNFTYIAAVRPAMAFIVDIRRQAVVQHLMFKAVFEMAKDRADFISILFDKPRPAGLDSTTSIQAMWEAYRTVATDSALAARNWTRLVDRLTRTHEFTLSAAEMSQLRAVFDAFYYYGPAITTRGGGGFSGRGGDFADLTGFALDRTGAPQSFLSSEINYQYVKGLHDRNLIVPVSGDFAGPKAIRAIGAWLQGRGTRVSAFYVSNVEQYLFGDGHAQRFYDNVATLPTDSTSVFIRPYSMRRGAQTESLCAIEPFLRAARSGLVTSNYQALACAR